MTLTATGDTATYHWELGDGGTADGPVVQHTYAAGRFTAHVTATNPLGETSQATVAITATGITLAGPGAAATSSSPASTASSFPRSRALGSRSTETARGSRPCARTAAGSFFVRGRVGTPDARYTVRYAGAVSNAVALAVRPGLDTAFSGSGRLGTPLSLLVRERPATAGTVSVKVWRGHRLVAGRSFHGRLRLRLPTGSRGRLPRAADAATGSRLPRRPARARADRLRPVARARLGRPERLRARPPAARPPLRARPRRRLLRPGRHRRGLRLPEAARPAAHGPRGRALLARAAAGQHPSGALPGRPTSRSARAGRCCSSSATARSR